MGLDTSHNCWHGSYSSFAAWRNAIAQVLGWGSEDTSYGSTTYQIPEGRIPDQAPLPDETITEDGETYVVKWSESYDNSVWLGHWDTDPADVIDVLMVHSDCEGVIPARFTGPLADRLEALAPLLSDEGWDRDHAEQFATGLRMADLLGEDVDFH